MPFSLQAHLIQDVVSVSSLDGNKPGGARPKRYGPASCLLFQVLEQLSLYPVISGIDPQQFPRPSTGSGHCFSGFYRQGAGYENQSL